jgi:urease accessory protein
LNPRAFQLFDSALPIGSFNYSSGVEEAFYQGYDVREFIEVAFKTVVLRGDAVIAKLSYEDPYTADRVAYASKLTRELKEMSVNMGRSLARLDLCEDYFLRAVKEGRTRGTYPAVVGRVCLCLGIGKEECALGVAYSELATMAFSAVRLGAMTFYEAQKLIGRLLEEAEVGEEFEPSFPLLDLLSRLHERREPKVFMS